MKTEIIIGLLLLGLIFCSTHKHSDVVESFEGLNECPNVLVQRGDKLMLLNTRKAKVPGINPILFNNLEEYTEFVQWQQAMKIKCPILYFQQRLWNLYQYCTLFKGICSSRKPQRFS